MSIGLRFGHDATIPGGDFFMQLVDAAAEAADTGGYGLLLRRSGRPRADFADAHIVVDPAETDELSERDQGVPVVTIGRTRADDVPWVDVDHQAAMTTLLGHLSLRASSGPVWFVTLPQHLGFVDALEAAFTGWAKAHERDAEVLQTGTSPQETVELLQSRLAVGIRPALIVTALDGQAAGAHHAINAAGLELPVGSASDGAALGLLAPPVSAMALDGAGHGRTAVRMLLDWIRTGEAPGNKVLPARLRARG